MVDSHPDPDAGKVVAGWSQESRLCPDHALEEGSKNIWNIVEGDHQRLSTAVNSWSQRQVAGLAFWYVVLADSSRRHHPKQLVHIVFTRTQVGAPDVKARNLDGNYSLQCDTEAKS